MPIAIIVSQFNKKISNRLLNGAKRALKASGIFSKDTKIFKAPGVFEIPFLAAKLAHTKKFDGIIALGCVLKGETEHFRLICDGVAFGIQKVSIEYRIPVMFGVLMCHTLKQAMARSKIDPKKNKGYECAKGLLRLLGY